MCQFSPQKSTWTFASHRQINQDQINQDQINQDQIYLQPAFPSVGVH